MTKEEAIKILKSKMDGSVDTSYEWAEAVRMAIEALRQTGWIPVSERLPDDKTYVLTTIQVNGRQPHARSGFYHGGFFHNDNGETWTATEKPLKAWMPLPEPYKDGDADMNEVKPQYMQSSPSNGADLISRDEAVALVNKAIRGIGDKDAQEYLFDGLRKQMWALPSAEPKTGKWILQDTSYWRATHAGDVQVNRVNLKCSFCGWRNHEKKEYNYCPNCGADMRGEEG